VHPRFVAVVPLLALAAALAGCSSGAPPVIEVTPTGDTSVDAVDLTVGACILDDSSAATVSSVEVVDCTSSHDAEVFASIVLADGSFPGADAVAQMSIDQCAVQFAAFVGIAFANSELTYEYYAPSETTWAAGDRAVLCLVRDSAGPVTGSLHGVAR
jgi:hypothetical protein